MWRHRLAAFEYAFPLDSLIKQLKYKEKKSIARVLGLLLAQSVLAHGYHRGVDYLLPVPLAWSRRRERGFNQAADIAVACGSVLARPTNDLWLQRRSLLGAFAASSEVADKHIALVDDVMTSGATSAELARELLDRGAASVCLWTVARTVMELSEARI